MVDITDYIEFTVTEEIENAARELITSSPGITNRSFMKGAGITPGAYGEAALKTILGNDAVSENTINYDIRYCGYSLEVKSKTTTRSTPPPLHYECSLVGYIAGQQKCNFYVFTRIYKYENKFAKGWILGYINPKEYMEKSNFLKKGELDTRNNYIVRNNCYNLEIKHLHPIRNLLED